MTQNTQSTKQSKKQVKAPTRTRTISFRVTEEEYKNLVNRCTNKHGERLMTPSDFARYSTLNYTTSTVKHEDPLERYRIAIAAQLTTKLSELIISVDSRNYLGSEGHFKILAELSQNVVDLREQIYQLLNTNNIVGGAS
ncbi:hypothetical protein [Methylotuvimicrobium buryatense]|uniref:Uncharacterized protein n=1 Tax=Methylotuvimicrobium buryatense TaxID=95641 RepID=A0A4P9UIQ9_METBY|nr:hypothetical protein [Methylotuvimicrobium buryatense]QCW81032.1 hypothetical protein EQU24_01255 [Methylotuvimicrobium buryatense]